MSEKVESDRNKKYVKVFTLFGDRVEVVYMMVERYTINMYVKIVSVIIRRTEVRGIT